ncbi:MAG: hypothetical protein QOD70_1221 [Frankiales bacterium]|jgi:very-short-patch-repair endonuclease|nr:hypothetical protein [Frankiales bacterium]
MDRSTTRQLVAKARAQHGLLEPADLPRGVTVHDLVRRGHWTEVLPGVLGPAAVEPTRELRESAAMLWPGRVVLSHFSAARRSGLWVPEDDRAWVSTEFSSPRRDLPGLKVFRTRNLLDRVIKDGFHQWTPPRRTIADLASILTRKQLEAVLLSAIRQDATTAAEVEATIVGLERRRGMRALRELLSLWSPERETMLEDRLHRNVCAVVAEEVKRQFVISRRDGSVQARVDVAVPELLLAFEADGLFFHSTDEQIAADQKRDRGMLTRGWQTVRFREGVLDDQAAVRSEIRGIVERRRQDRRAA